MASQLSRSHRRSHSSDSQLFLLSWLGVLVLVTCYMPRTNSQPLLDIEQRGLPHITKPIGGTPPSSLLIAVGVKRDFRRQRIIEQRVGGIMIHSEFVSRYVSVGEGEVTDSRGGVQVPGIVVG